MCYTEYRLSSEKLRLSINLIMINNARKKFNLRKEIILISLVYFGNMMVLINYLLLLHRLALPIPSKTKELNHLFLRKEKYCLKERGSY